MSDPNEPTFDNDHPFRRTNHGFLTRLGRVLRRVVQLGRSAVRQCASAGLLTAAAFLLCQCHRQSSTQTQTPSTTPTPSAIPSPSATATITPSVTPTPTPTPTPMPAARNSLLPLPTATPTPDPFGDGIKQLLVASAKGFLDMRGKYKNTENGSGLNPLFRERKIYQGTFLLGDASSAELEEVYYTAGRQPAYNYHLYYQALSARVSIEKYYELRQNLNRVLRDFVHTFGERYDAWSRRDPLRTAVLLSSQDIAGSPEIQVHVAFPSPQW